MDMKFDYHQILHDSQTETTKSKSVHGFDYHQILHDSQTATSLCIVSTLFDYHQILHDSQTSPCHLWKAACLTTIRYYTTLKPIR